MSDEIARIQETRFDNTESESYQITEPEECEDSDTEEDIKLSYLQRLFDIPPRWPFNYLDKYVNPECPFINKRWTLISLAYFGLTFAFLTHFNTNILKSKNLFEADNINKIERVERTIAIINHAFFWSFLVAQVPGGFFSMAYPANEMFGLCLSTSFLLNILIPAALQMDPVIIMFIRIVQGFAEGMAVPAIANMLHHWSPIEERARMSCILFSSPYAGFFSGLMLTYFFKLMKYPDTMYYIYCSFGIFWWLLWRWLTFETPRHHSNISSHELYLIEQTSRSTGRTSFIEIPWKNILTSKCVYAIVAANFCRCLNYFLMIATELDPTQLPVLFHFTRLHLHDLIVFGSLSLIIPISGLISDILVNKKVFTITDCRKIFTCVGFLFEILPYIIKLLVPLNNSSWIIVSSCLGGISLAGFNVNYLDIAPKYSSLLMGINNAFGLITGTICAFIISFYNNRPPSNTLERTLPIMISLVLMVFSMVFYGIYASGDAQSWAEPIVQEHRTKTRFEIKYHKEVQSHSSTKLWLWCVCLIIIIYILTYSYHF